MIFSTLDSTLQEPHPNIIFLILGVTRQDFYSSKSIGFRPCMHQSTLALEELIADFLSCCLLMNLTSCFLWLPNCLLLYLLLTRTSQFRLFTSSRLRLLILVMIYITGKRHRSNLMIRRFIRASKVPNSQ